MYKDDEYFNGNIDTEFLSRDCEGFEEENEYGMRGNGNAPVKQMPPASTEFIFSDRRVSSAYERTVTA